MKSIFLLICLGSFIPLFASAAPFPLQPVKGDRFLIDMRYNSENNFLKKNMYQDFVLLRECYVRPDLYQRLLKTIDVLRQLKLKLVFFDCYRPLSVQKAMWKLVPDPRYVANPRTGSNHNRGVAIDATLAHEDGSLLPMPTDFDDFTPKASVYYQCKNDEKEKCANRDLLRRILEGAGLVGLSSEWWHFQLPQSSRYPLVEQSETLQ